MTGATPPERAARWYVMSLWDLTKLAGAQGCVGERDQVCLIPAAAVLSGRPPQTNRKEREA